MNSPEQQWRDAGWLYHTKRGLKFHPGIGFAILLWAATAAAARMTWLGILVGAIWPAIVIYTAKGVSHANPPWRRWEET